MNIELDIFEDKFFQNKNYQDILPYTLVCLTETTHNLHLPEKHVLFFPHLTIINFNHQQ